MGKKRRKRSAMDARKKEKKQKVPATAEDVCEESYIRPVARKPLTMKQWSLGMVAALLFLFASTYGVAAIIVFTFMGK